MKKKILASLSMAAMMAFSAVTGFAAPKTIKIGLDAPLSGNNGVYGTSQMKGYQLAMDEINAAGGVNGAMLELVTYDNLGDVQNAATGAQKFADDDDILAIGGCCLSSCTLAMVPIIDDAGLPELVVSSSTPNLTGSSEYFFRMAVQDADVGPQFARVMKERGITTAVALYPNNDYGLNLSRAFAAMFTAEGGEGLASIDYAANDQDYTAILTTVKSLAPGGVALCGTATDSGLLIKQMKQLGIDAFIIGAPGLYNQKTVEIAGSAAEGVCCVSVFVDNNPDPKVQELVAKYVEKNGMKPDSYAALAYDQMYVIADAAKRAMDAGELTRDTLKDALKETNYEGVTGTVTFNEGGDWVRPYLVLQINAEGNYIVYEG